MNDISPSLKCTRSEVPQLIQLYTLKLLSPQSMMTGRCRIGSYTLFSSIPFFIPYTRRFPCFSFKENFAFKVVSVLFYPEYLVLICQISKTKTAVEIWGGEDYFKQYTNINLKQTIDL